MLGNTHGLYSFLEFLLSSLHLLLLRTVNDYRSLGERCGIKYLSHHLQLAVLTHLSCELVLILNLQLVGRSAWMQVDLRQTVLGRVNETVVHTVHKAEVQTGNRLALIGDEQVDHVLLHLGNLGFDTNQNAVYLLRDPYGERLLNTVLIYLHGIGVLQTLQQAEGPVVVTQGIVDTSLALSVLSSVDITQYTVLALLEHFLQFVFVDIANHISLGLVGNPDGTAVVKTTSSVCLDDSLHGGLRVNLIAIVYLLHIEVSLTLYCY